MTNSPTGNRENMPEWAEDDPRSYWEAADEHERVNGRFSGKWNLLCPGS